MSGPSLPLVLSPGASVTFSAVFTPQSAANATGDITVASNGSNSTLSVSLSGTGTAQGSSPSLPRIEFWQCDGGHERQSDQQPQRQRCKRDRFVGKPEQ